MLHAMQPPMQAVAAASKHAPRLALPPPGTHQARLARAAPMAPRPPRARPGRAAPAPTGRAQAWGHKHLLLLLQRRLPQHHGQVVDLTLATTSLAGRTSVSSGALLLPSSRAAAAVMPLP